MSRFPFVLAIVLLIAASLPSRAVAQTAPAAAPASGEHLKATITGVEGPLVQVKESEEAGWKDAKVGMVVAEDAEFRTGPRSAVRFSFPPDQTITLDRLGTVKLLQAVNDGGKIKTNIGMKYGRTRYDIEAAGREHEASITSPSSTLAVRGTDFSSFDQRPFPAEAVSLRGRVEFRGMKKQAFLGGKNPGKARLTADSPNAASAALSRTVVDPSIALARTQSEDALIASLLSSGSVLSFDYDRGIRVVKGGSVPRTDAELIPTLPGTLNFVLRWTGNTDLNLVVIAPNPTSPNGSTAIYPLGGFNLAPSGGTMPFDHRGGPNGGIEYCFWPGTFPDGVYRIGAQLMSGPNTPATVDVFRDGKRVPIRTGQGDVTTASFTAMPIDPNIATGIAVGLVSLFPSQEGGAAPVKASAATPLALKKPSAPTKAVFTGPLPINPAKSAMSPSKSKR
jgi:hypothetical protein